MTQSPSGGRRRTPQQRKRDAARRAGDRTSEPAIRPGSASGVDRGPAETPPVDTRLAALDDVSWSIRGRLTLALMTAIVSLPIGLVGYFVSHGHLTLTDRDGHTLTYTYSLGYFLVATLGPSILPIYLVICTFVAMPLARTLAREPRSYRILETLGFAAVTDIVLIIAFQRLPTAPASFTDGGVIAATALAEVVGLVGGAYLYGPISTRLSPKRRMRRR